MLVTDFAGRYRTKSDDELLQLAEDADQISPEALEALRGELARRRIEPSDTSSSNPTASAQPAPIAIAPRSKPSGCSLSEPGIRSFVEDILAMYRSWFWTFFQLSAVGAVAGYIVFAIGGYEARGIVNQFVRGPRFLNAQIWIEILLLNLTTIFLFWTVTFLVFAMICSAVERARLGNTPSVRDSVLPIMRRPLGVCQSFSFAVPGSFAGSPVHSCCWFRRLVGV
jgi:hypothetical protein